MREDDERIGTRLRRGIAYRHLASRFTRRDREGILRYRGDILAGVLRSRGIPDLAREVAAPRAIQSLDGTNANGKGAAEEWIVRRWSGHRRT